jgi:endoglucanase
MATVVPFKKGVNFTKWFETRIFTDINFKKYSEQDFINIKSLGADVVRLPVRFHDYVLSDKKHTLNGELLKYLDTIADWAEKHGIYLILDNHSFHSINATDAKIGGILIPVWKQLAAHFKNRSEFIIYEILNEPHGISDKLWIKIQGKAIKEIRKIDKKHLIIAGGTNYNSIEKMTKLPVYRYDNLIYTFHFYDPHIFTHQGATWNRPSLAPLSFLPFPLGENKIPPIHETFKGTWVEGSLNSYLDDSKPEKLCETLDKARSFSEKNDVPVFCGEFGVFMLQSPEADRVKWYKFVCEELEKRGIPWTCWDYFGGFGIFKTQERGEFPSGLNSDIVKSMGFNI